MIVVRSSLRRIPRDGLPNELSKAPGQHPDNAKPLVVQDFFMICFDDWTIAIRRTFL
jgi:hypothetical protein